MSRVVFDAKKKIGVDKHYTVEEFTPEELAKDCICKIPIKTEDVVLDCSRGCNPVWFDNFPTKNKRYCDIKEGSDFLKYNEEVDWIVGNPPFRDFVAFCYHASEISNKGFGFLINHTRLNQITPKRLDDFKQRGFFLSGLFIVGVKKWFGRYYFIYFTKRERENISWSRKNY